MGTQTGRFNRGTQVGGVKTVQDDAWVDQIYQQQQRNATEVREQQQRAAAARNRVQQHINRQLYGGLLDEGDSDEDDSLAGLDRPRGEQHGLARSGGQVAPRRAFVGSGQGTRREGLSAELRQMAVQAKEQRERNRKGKTRAQNNAGPSTHPQTPQEDVVDDMDVNHDNPVDDINASQGSERPRVPATRSGVHGEALGPRKTIFKKPHTLGPRRSGRTRTPVVRFTNSNYAPRGGRSAHNRRMYSNPPRDPEARAHVNAALDAVVNGRDAAIANAHIEEAVNHLQVDAPDAPEIAAGVIEANRAINAQNAADATQHVENARNHLQAAEKRQRERNRKGKAVAQNNAGPSHHGPNHAANVNRVRQEKNAKKRELESIIASSAKQSCEELLKNIRKPTEAETLKAFRKWSLKFHPDKTAMYGVDSKDYFQRVSECFKMKSQDQLNAEVRAAQAAADTEAERDATSFYGAQSSTSRPTGPEFRHHSRPPRPSPYARPQRDTRHNNLRRRQEARAAEERMREAERSARAFYGPKPRRKRFHVTSAPYPLSRRQQKRDRDASRRQRVRSYLERVESSNSSDEDAALNVDEERSARTFYGPKPRRKRVHVTSAPYPLSRRQQKRDRDASRRQRVRSYMERPNHTATAGRTRVPKRKAGNPASPDFSNVRLPSTKRPRNGLGLGFGLALGVTQQTPRASHEEVEGQEGRWFGTQAAFIRPGVAARHKT
ncbi:hypothetical protein KFL_009420055 [Klebsormidium nitens]|uniref:J domain-containing protein n=1 Tax=Klebsormidium nitens TaxID=105231 RepID=A0A1Y1IN88_KLENI|nr:hypothetical protein KFL_009420055 [Klebsormidium nitens]|eukprot:GAQ92194.1 hypothetical protein KFL_009420055 [Klebsormidium nitens]